MKNIPLSSKGFVYYDFGDKFLDETMISIQTLLFHNPNAKVCLLTNPEGEKYVKQKYPNNQLDRIIAINRKKDEPLVFFKLSVKELSPYQKTIYLDGDTYITDYIEDLFDLVDTFDFVAVPDESHSSRGGIIGLRGGYRALGFYNCGFFIFRKSKVIDDLFENWKKEYLALGDLDIDQGALVRALIKTNIRFITLPKEYNLRIINKCTSFQNRVKILHGRVRNPEKFIKKINNIKFVNSGSRVWLPHFQILFKAESFQWIYKIRKLLSLRRVKEDAGLKEHTDIPYLKRIFKKLNFHRSPILQSTYGSDTALFDYFIQKYSIQSIQEFKTKKIYLAEYLKEKNISYVAYDLSKKLSISSEKYDLVTFFEIPTYSKFFYASRALKILTDNSARFILISLKPDHPDWEWVQLITDHGFYFDPHLTLHLRNLAQSDHLKRRLLIFEKER